MKALCFRSASLLLLLALAACSQADPNEPLAPSGNSPIADVPIPAGFSMTSDSRSSLTPNSNLRFVDHYYKGSEDFLPTVRFFRDELPPKGWSLLTQEQSGKQVVLNYSKGGEDLVIIISEGNTQTHVNVRIYPSARPSPAAGAAAMKCFLVEVIARVLNRREQLFFQHS